MKRPSISDAVYHRTFPRPKQRDPGSFLVHIQRHLVPEVREEVQRYFGRIDCLEAQYPGLDYTYAPHRRRLASFTWHRRLFRVFDDLHLTKAEILTLCTWEGTRAAKERFERESGQRITTTTLDGVASQEESTGPRVEFCAPPPSRPRSTCAPRRTLEEIVAADASEDSDDDDLEESIGVQLNENLLAAAQARERGEAARFDLQWEQWMKEAIERNEITDPSAILETLRQRHPFANPPGQDSAGLPETMLPDTIPSVPVDEPMDDTADSMQPGTQYRRLQHAVDELAQSSERISAETEALVNGQATDETERGTPAEERSRLANLVDELRASTTIMHAENSAMQNLLSRGRTETAR
jgi:hypothetical protein